MTDEQKFLTALAALAKACQFQMNSELVGFYDEGLSPLGYETAARVVKEALINRRGTDRMPSIRDLKDLANPSLTIEGAAQELLTRIVQAVHMFGYVDPNGAREYMGELAWNALPEFHGWEEFTSADIPIATARAQLRDRLIAKLRIEYPNGRVCLPPPGTPTFQTYIEAQISPREENRERQLSQLKLLMNREK